jgi:carbon storage regulator
MLVLSRKAGESIMIGDHVVTVLGVQGGKIRLGVDAPREVPVFRKEVYERRRQEAVEQGSEAA